MVQIYKKTFGKNQGVEFLLGMCDTVGARKRSNVQGHCHKISLLLGL